MKTLLAGVGATAVAVLAAPATASADTAQPRCAVVYDHITKTDNGHGAPAEWADLSLNRTTTVCGDSVALTKNRLTADFTAVGRVSEIVTRAVTKD